MFYIVIGGINYFAQLHKNIINIFMRYVIGVLTPSLISESLRSCDYCRRLYHSVGCHTPTIPLSNNEEFKCNICVAEGKTRRMACGKCDGCLREDDCMSCTACIAKYERGDKKRSKCVFRKCKFLGKAFTGAADEDQDEGEDIHDTDCFVCQEGGGRSFTIILLLCHTSSYRSNVLSYLLFTS